LIIEEPVVIYSDLILNSWFICHLPLTLIIQAYFCCKIVRI